jgi:hypothetical protein
MRLLVIFAALTRPGCRGTAKFDAIPSKAEGGDCRHQNQDRR